MPPPQFLLTDSISAMSDDSTDQNVEQWKVKKLMKQLTEARGNGTSMISLIIPPKDQVRLATAPRTRAWDTFASRGASRQSFICSRGRMVVQLRGAGPWAGGLFFLPSFRGGKRRWPCAARRGAAGGFTA